MNVNNPIHLFAHLKHLLTKQPYFPNFIGSEWLTSFARCLFDSLNVDIRILSIFVRALMNAPWIWMACGKKIFSYRFCAFQWLYVAFFFLFCWSTWYITHRYIDSFAQSPKWWTKKEKWVALTRRISKKLIKINDNSFQNLCSKYSKQLLLVSTNFLKI